MTISETYPLHGGQLRQIAHQFGLAPEELLDFSANINPAGPPPGVLSAIRNALNAPSSLTAYPDLQEIELRESIAAYVGAGRESISVANGFVPLLEAALRALRIRSCVLPVPAFVEYRRTLERIGVVIEPHAFCTASCFRYDSVATALGRQEAILLANPQNPSGVVHDRPTIRGLIARAAEMNIYVLLDEAFIDYNPEQSLANETEEFSNLIVFRSVTKFHGIPGLRVAYAVAHPGLTKLISESLSPWAITTLASRGVQAALEDHEYADRSRSINGMNSAALERGIHQLGLRTYPSGANFLLFQLPSAIDPDSFWRYMIVEHRIVLRNCANYEALAPGHFRVAVRAPEENNRLLLALREALSSWELS